VITKDWTYSATKPEHTSPLHSVLFDRNKDPFQLENLFDSEAHQEVRDSLWRITAGWMAEFEDAFYTHEDLGVWSKEEWDRNYEKLPIEVLRTSNKE